MIFIKQFLKVSPIINQLLITFDKILDLYVGSQYKYTLRYFAPNELFGIIKFK